MLLPLPPCWGHCVHHRGPGLSQEHCLHPVKQGGCSPRSTWPDPCPTQASPWCLRWAPIFLTPISVGVWRGVLWRVGELTTPPYIPDCKCSPRSSYLAQEETGASQRVRPALRHSPPESQRAQDSEAGTWCTAQSETKGTLSAWMLTYRKTTLRDLVSTSTWRQWQLAWDHGFALLSSGSHILECTQLNLPLIQ
jgi:hypothetical protein